MNIPAKELQLALQEYQEWGEKLRIPRDVRISKLLPHRSEGEISEIITLCKNVEETAWRIADTVRNNGISKENAIKQIEDQFPFLNSENISRTYSQAMYYALK